MSMPGADCPECDRRLNGPTCVCGWTPTPTRSSSTRESDRDETEPKRCEHNALIRECRECEAAGRAFFAMLAQHHAAAAATAEPFVAELRRRLASAPARATCAGCALEITDQRGEYRDARLWHSACWAIARSQHQARRIVLRRRTA